VAGQTSHTRLIHYEANRGFWERERASEGRRCFDRGTLNADRKGKLEGSRPVQRPSLMARFAKAQLRILEVSLRSWKGTMTGGRSNDVIARPISSPSPWSSGCRQLAWKYWDRGRGKSSSRAPSCRERVLDLGPSSNRSLIELLQADLLRAHHP
jgi:hypothetical protein